jgi:sialic acid synthase SpsE
MTEINIGERKIGLLHKPYFIADIGANHDGSLERAFTLIEKAKEAGADAAKFQNFRAETIVSRKGFQDLPLALSHQSSWDKPVYDVYEQASLPLEWTARLKDKCDQIGIEYFTTPYDLALVDYVDPYVRVFKIGSGDITWHDLISHIASKGKPVMIATGASTRAEVESAMEIVLTQNRELVIMQCNTNYTGNWENIRSLNLNVLKSYRESYPSAVLGLSDHSHGHSAVLGALALGARVFEKHFTDDNQRVGPDHYFAMNPVSWHEMVDRTNELFLSLGDGIKRIEENEKEAAVVQRRSLRFTRDLKTGYQLTIEDIFPLRPECENGIPPYDVKKILSKKLRRDVSFDEIVTWEDLLSVDG